MNLIFCIFYIVHAYWFIRSRFTSDFSQKCLKMIVSVVFSKINLKFDPNFSVLGISELDLTWRNKIFQKMLEVKIAIFLFFGHLEMCVYFLRKIEFWGNTIKNSGKEEIFNINRAAK